MHRIRELIADGVTSTEIRRLRRDHTPLAWGVYIHPEVESWERYRLECVERWVRLKPGAALTGPSAAAVREVPMLGEPPSRVYESNVTPGRYAPGVRVLPTVPTCAPDSPSPDWGTTW